MDEADPAEGNVSEWKRAWLPALRGGTRAGFARRPQSLVRRHSPSPIRAWFRKETLRARIAFSGAPARSRPLGVPCA